MKALMITAGLCALLGGCAPFPPVLFMAEATAADGALPASTGMDHGISLVSGRDCAVWRSSNGLAICADDHDIIQAATASEVPALAPEQPAEVVGEEGHHVVLDGRS